MRCGRWRFFFFGFIHCISKKSSVFGKINKLPYRRRRPVPVLALFGIFSGAGATARKRQEFLIHLVCRRKRALFSAPEQIDLDGSMKNERLGESATGPGVCLAAANSPVKMV